MCNYLLEKFVGQCIYIARSKLFSADLRIYREQAYYFDLELIIRTIFIGTYDNIFHNIVNRVVQIHIETISEQGVFMFVVNHNTLRFNHVIEFKQTITNNEVILIYI